ncbi:hypothetical protein V6N13_101550 [Hibiscus sabdariffa]|uniref:TF-B3 domain-containing protein n=1 Tax=Hibiscus sabdariffa TaxID=183260 RepID=A0ABR2QLN0_9ROSI
MSVQSTNMFSKLLTETDIKKRLAIPVKTLSSLPAFNGSHAIKIHLLYGTRMWPIDCSVRKKGYKKPVFSGGLWRDFVIGNKLNVGDRISMYKVQDSHYRVEVDQTPVACCRKVNNKRKRVLEAPDAPRSFFDQVIDKPSIKIFGAMGYGTSDATGEACTDQNLSLDLVLQQPTPYAGGDKLDLNLVPPTSETYVS